MTRSRPLLLALLVTLALLGAWRWHSLANEAKAARKAAWMEYLHGALSDLLYGSTRLQSPLARKKPTKKDLAEIADAVDHLRDSAKEAAGVGVLAGSDKQMQWLANATQWHGEIYDLFQNWRNMVGRPLAPQALQVEPEFLQKIWSLLDTQRGVILQDQSLTKDEVLEMNALLYSLKEGTAR